MAKEFHQIQWGERLEDDIRQLVRLAIREDLDGRYDWTTVALVSDSSTASASLVAREAGVVAGLVALPTVLDEVESTQIEWTPNTQDGASVRAHETLGTLRGPTRELLTLERQMLNLVGHLSGIATLTSQFVQHTDGTPAQIYDTRKTQLGYRKLEKYAVNCGGGRNHRTGLFDAILIKDNHLAHCRDETSRSAGQAVRAAREFVTQNLPELAAEMIIEVEVDNLEQLRDVLTETPDIVLLDNMSTAQLAKAVQIRDALASTVELEASGGIDLLTIRSISETGVDRVSVGALTHSSPCFDVGLDWDIN